MDLLIIPWIIVTIFSASPDTINLTIMKNIGKYLKEALVFDLKAGFITAIVALPLAIAFAIASGVPPIMGLYTAIIAGILGSGFGGSRFSITGPTGAMTVIILSTVTRFGIEGLLMAGLLAGLFQIAFGLMKFGKFVRYIPLPIISGFTAGIGVIIFIGQIPNFFGLTLAPKEFVWETIIDVIAHLGNVRWAAVDIAITTMLIIILFPKITEKIKPLKVVPPTIVALIVFTIATFVLAINVPVVGEIHGGLPMPQLPNFDLGLVRDVLPAALTIALLGSIEALLCAVVCDAMTGTKHKSNKELIGQGIANVVLPFFNAIPSTAAIARSAVNIREGAKTKYAGIIHALILLIIVMFFAPAAQHIPRAFLAGILMFVSAKMVDLHEFRTIMKISRSDTIVLFITFFLTVFTDLVFAVQAGMMLAILLLFVKLTHIVDVTHMEEYDPRGTVKAAIKRHPKLKDNVAIYTIHGPFFFGAMNVFDRKINEHINIRRSIIVLRNEHVTFIDSTGVVRLNSFLEERKNAKSTVLLTGLQPAVKKVLFSDKEFNANINKDHIFETLEDALLHIETTLLPIDEKSAKTGN